MLSCTPDVVVLKQKKFFDLKKYFNQEIEKLSSVHSVKKVTTFNGKVDEKLLDHLDFKEELKKFLDADINKISWIDKYQVDSMLINNQLNQLTYTTDNPKLKTKKLEIHFKDGKANQVHIQKKSGNILTTSEQNLVYNSNKGYTISTTQELIFFKDRILKVEVNFVN